MAEIRGGAKIRLLVRRPMRMHFQKFLIACKRNDKVYKVAYLNE